MNIAYFCFKAKCWVVIKHIFACVSCLCVKWPGSARQYSHLEFHLDTLKFKPQLCWLFLPFPSLALIRVHVFLFAYVYFYSSRIILRLRLLTYFATSASFLWTIWFDSLAYRDFSQFVFRIRLRLRRRRPQNDRRDSSITLFAMYLCITLYLCKLKHS